MVRAFGALAREQARFAATVRAILAHHDRNRDFMSQFGAGRFPACSARSAERLMDKFRENNRRVMRILKACARDRVLAAVSGGLWYALRGFAEPA